MKWETPLSDSSQVQLNHTKILFKAVFSKVVSKEKWTKRKEMKSRYFTLTPKPIPIYQPYLIMLYYGLVIKIGKNNFPSTVCENQNRFISIFWDANSTLCVWASILFWVHHCIESVVTLSIIERHLCSLDCSQLCCRSTPIEGQFLSGQWKTQTARSTGLHLYGSNLLFGNDMSAQLV